jgi:Tfp pilus assembly protein PilZ
VDLESDDNLYAGLSYDISAGGLFVATMESPPVGAPIDVVVMLPDGTRLELRGVVRWVRDVQQASPGLPPGCGIAWEQLPMDALHLLLRFAQLREPILYET